MSKFRLALVRQKYRPDGGAERFVSRALEALDSSHLQLNVITREWQGPVKPDWQIHICNPRKWGASAASAGLPTPRGRSGSANVSTVQSHERIPGCDLYRAGDGVHRRWLQQRSRILPARKSRLLFADRYHRYVMQAEREMYEDPHLRGVICNAEMIKREIIEDFIRRRTRSTLSITPLITSVSCRRAKKPLPPYAPNGSCRCRQPA